MKKKINLCFPALALAALLSGCQEKPAPQPEEQVQAPASDTVSLTVWGAEEDEELLCQIIDGFQEAYRGHPSRDIVVRDIIEDLGNRIWGSKRGSRPVSD